MERLRTYVLVLLISIGVGTLSACSLWDMLKPGGGPALNVETELVVGDKEQQVNTDIGHTTQTADKIEITNVDTNPGFFWSLLFFLGWLLPGPPIPWGKLWSKIRRR